MDRDHDFQTLVASTVEPVHCAGKAIGVRTSGTVEGVLLETTFCGQKGARFQVTTSTRALPAGGSVADQINPGTADVLVDGAGIGWEGEQKTDAVAISEFGVALAIGAPSMRVERRLVHLAGETFPAPAIATYGGSSATRNLTVMNGDALDAIGASRSATRDVRVRIGGQSASGRVAVLDGNGREMAHGDVPAEVERHFRLPPEFGAQIELRDANGVVVGRGALS